MSVPPLPYKRTAPQTSKKACLSGVFRWCRARRHAVNCAACPLAVSTVVTRDSTADEYKGLSVSSLHRCHTSTAPQLSAWFAARSSHRRHTSTAPQLSAWFAARSSYRRHTSTAPQLSAGLPVRSPHRCHTRQHAVERFSVRNLHCRYTSTATQTSTNVCLSVVLHRCQRAQYHRCARGLPVGGLCRCLARTAHTRKHAPEAAASGA